MMIGKKHKEVRNETKRKSSCTHVWFGGLVCSHLPGGSSHLMALHAVDPTENAYDLANFDTHAVTERQSRA